jgi:hypothetical protein
MHPPELSGWSDSATSGTGSLPTPGYADDVTDYLYSADFAEPVTGL